MVQGFHFKNMLPPEEVLPDGACESNNLMEDLAGQFARSTGEPIVFDLPRRSDRDGRCILLEHPHPSCLAANCPSGEECKKLWNEHLGIACGSHTITQWQCPGGNTALIGCVRVDAHLLYIGKVVLRPRSNETNTPLVKNTMYGTLREMELTIQNSILKQKLETEPQTTNRARQKTPEPEHPAVKHAIDHINEHYRNANLSLISVADAIGISPGYLSTLFHGQTGIALHDHVRKLRLDSARELMETTHLTLSEIARHTGFSTSRNLRRALDQAGKSKK